MMSRLTKGARNQNQGFCALSVLRRCQRRVLSGLFLCLSFCFSPVFAQSSLSAPVLKEVSSLVDEGVPGLSLILLDRTQPSLEKNPTEWLEWQKQRIDIFKRQGQWDTIVHQYEALSDTAPKAYQEWLRLQVIESYLAMGDAESARDLLLPMIWTEGANKKELAQWRSLVIQGYLAEGRNGDAHTASLRYEQDYASAGDDAGWIALKARILIASGEADKAMMLTVSSQDALGRATHTLARLKGTVPMNEKLMTETMKWLVEPQLVQDLRQELFAAAFEKIIVITALANRIVFLERLLAAPDIDGARIAAAADALWNAYDEYGREVANRMQLLVGNFNPWFKAAEQLRQSSPLEARSLYARLAFLTKNSEQQARSHTLLVGALVDQKQAEILLAPLYLSSSRFTDVSSLPVVAMYRLVDMALDQGDLALASKLMSHLDAPAGVDLVEWKLRRARVQILVGVPSYGADLLKQMIEKNQLSRTQLDRLIEAVFDLQNVGEHEQAYEILNALLPKAPEVSFHRELLFWMADSRLAQRQYGEAARLYLRSAALIGPKAMDAWAQTARFHAAGALAEAGLKEDAIGLYRSVLAVTGSSDRRAALQREIQRLTSQLH